jgi:hypothetical protein
MEKRLSRTTDGGWSYQDVSEDEGFAALHFGHSLLLQVVNLQDEYFNLALDGEVNERIRAYTEVGIDPETN